MINHITSLTKIKSKSDTSSKALQKAATYVFRTLAKIGITQLSKFEISSEIFGSFVIGKVS